MSYCFPAFDPYDGFGPQPGNVIRNTVNMSGNCLTACGPPSKYCLSYGLNSSNKYIKNVVLGSINNVSGNDYGYGNYISKSTNLTVGASYTITLTPGSNSSTKFWRAWIDYNGDEDFDDAGELVGQKSGTKDLSFSFTVPGSISPISTRIRISMAYDAYASSCGSFANGEVEDYTVVIKPSQSPDEITNSDNVMKSQQVIAYPNPVENEITLRNTNNEKLGEVIIYNVTGQMIYQKFISDYEWNINITDLESGIYFVRIDQKSILKFIKR
jgi:hypothetical protein